MRGLIMRRSNTIKRLHPCDYETGFNSNQPITQTLNTNMPDYRRYRVPGGTYFFTVNLLERHPNDLLTRHIAACTG